MGTAQSRLLWICFSSLLPFSSGSVELGGVLSIDNFAQPSVFWTVAGSGRPTGSSSLLLQPGSALYANVPIEGPFEIDMEVNILKGSQSEFGVFCLGGDAVSVKNDILLNSHKSFYGVNTSFNGFGAFLGSKDRAGGSRSSLSAGASTGNRKWSSSEIPTSHGIYIDQLWKETQTSLSIRLSSSSDCFAGYVKNREVDSVWRKAFSVDRAASSSVGQACTVVLSNGAKGDLELTIESLHFKGGSVNHDKPTADELNWRNTVDLNMQKNEQVIRDMVSILSGLQPGHRELKQKMDQIHDTINSKESKKAQFEDSVKTSTKWTFVGVSLASFFSLLIVLYVAKRLKDIEKKHIL